MQANVETEVCNYFRLWLLIFLSFCFIKYQSLQIVGLIEFKVGCGIFNNRIIIDPTYEMNID